MKLDRLKWFAELAACAGKMWTAKAEFEAAEAEVQRLNGGDADNLNLSGHTVPFQCDGRPDAKECRNVVVRHSWEVAKDFDGPVYCKDCAPRIEAGKRAVAADEKLERPA